jgi:hypothetical protein
MCDVKLRIADNLIGIDSQTVLLRRHFNKVNGSAGLPSRNIRHQVHFKPEYFVSNAV